MHKIKFWRSDRFHTVVSDDLKLFAQLSRSKTLLELLLMNFIFLESTPKQVRTQKKTDKN